MIHSHYQPNEILWFLRNYWRYTREKLAEEWRRLFQDENFGKSQYQWLKTRYGMKPEWGAALNCPPYPGARPGAPGTENYEAPDIPASPPQTTFQTRPDTPAPKLISAGTSTPRSGSGSGSGSGGSRGRHASADQNQSSGMGQAYAARYPNAMGSAMSPSLGPAMGSSMSAAMQMPMPMPMQALPAGPAGAYAMNKAQAMTGLIGDMGGTNGASGSNGTNGTYSITLDAGLGSPFAPATSGGSSDPGMRPMMPSFPSGTTSSTINLVGALNQFPTASGPVGSQHTTSQQTAPLPTMGSFEFAMNPLLSYPGGDYFSSGPSSTAFFPPETSSPGLGIGYGNSYFPTLNSSAPLSAAVHSPPTLRAGRHDTLPSGGSTGVLPRTPGAAMCRGLQGSGSITNHVADMTAAPKQTQSPVDLGSKRKQAVMDVDCQAPKRIMLDPSLDIAANTGQVSTGQVSAAQFASDSPPGQGNGKATKPRRRKSTSPRASSPRAKSGSTSVQSPASPSSPIEVDGEWFDGAHGHCTISGHHRHDSRGGIYFFEQRQDNATAVTSANTNGSPGAAPASDASTMAAPTLVAETANMEMPSGMSRRSSGSFDLVSPGLGGHLLAPDQPGVQTENLATDADPTTTMAANLDGSKDSFADLMSVEHLLKTEVAARLYGNQASSAAAASSSADFGRGELVDQSGFDGKFTGHDASSALSVYDMGQGVGMYDFDANAGLPGGITADAGAAGPGHVSPADSTTPQEHSGAGSMAEVSSDDFFSIGDYFEFNLETQ